METPGIIAQKVRELFLKYGIRSVTMNDIAAELGIGKKTIYRYFESKDALVENFVEQTIHENEDTYNAFVSKINNPIIELFFTMVYAQRLYLNLNNTILFELEKNHHKAYLAVKQHKDGFIVQAVKTSMERGIKQHLYQDNFNPGIMSRFFVESLLLISDNSIFSSTTYNTTDLSEEIFGHLIGGIATSSGTDLINYYKDQHRFSIVTQTFKQPFWED
jgi:TetR/AcrR family transcriptional regulator, cholesterol catabolism regulator